MDQAKTYLLSAQQGASFKKDFMEQLDELKKDIKKDSIKYYQENKQQFIGKNDKTIEKIFKEEFWSLQLKKCSHLKVPERNDNPETDIINALTYEYKGTDQVELQRLTQGNYLFPKAFLKYKE